MMPKPITTVVAAALALAGCSAPTPSDRSVSPFAWPGHLHMHKPVNVSDINQGDLSSNPDRFVEGKDGVYFAATGTLTSTSMKQPGLRIYRCSAAGKVVPVSDDDLGLKYSVRHLTVAKRGSPDHLVFSKGDVLFKWDGSAYTPFEPAKDVEKIVWVRGIAAAGSKCLVLAGVTYDRCQLYWADHGSMTYEPIPDTEMACSGDGVLVVRSTTPVEAALLVPNGVSILYTFEGDALHEVKATAPRQVCVMADGYCFSTDTRVWHIQPKGGDPTPLSNGEFARVHGLSVVAGDIWALAASGLKTGLYRRQKGSAGFTLERQLNYLLVSPRGFSPSLGGFVFVNGTHDLYQISPHDADRCDDNPLVGRVVTMWAAADVAWFASNGLDALGNRVGVEPWFWYFDTHRHH